MNYQEALEFLYPLHRFGMKPGLERATALLDIFGMPHKRLGTIIHIAGTNGKGTTASALAAMFQAAGKKTALYTSPHLVDFTERMRIDGQPISAGRVAAYCSAMKERVVELRATFFEATTALAFAWFADEQVEVTVIETGMGGRLDATNVVKSDYAVITSIGRDHTAWLGTSPAMIAREKAAIINPESRVFTAVTDSEALAEIVRAAELNRVPLFRLERDVALRVESAEPGALEFSLSTAGTHYHTLRAPLTGAFHASNLALAVMVAEAAGIGEDAVRRGFLNLLKTGYRARLEKIGTMPDVFLDVSHNADGMRETAAAISVFRHRYRAMHVLIGLASDKEAGEVIRHLLPLDARFAAVTIPSERSIPASELAALLKNEGVDPLVFDTPLEGLRQMLEDADSRDMILVTGSFFLAGEILRRKGVQQR
ncbi:MAG: bifunctional folylpolyglutamate synthase/dihydrofolate synthase [Chlorobiaceae bacterium]|nr:bifunctional folylpolyglutamate synthase/dihydrofolate synthase [Chlorobiaceae bacterium]NTW94332.1 bifunctional folylpolyglutamate synthase/dihydrofolate synthase [Chlorobiaceae bacterium]